MKFDPILLVYALPLLALGREAVAKYAAEFNRYTAGLALILAANMVDLLPNATTIPFTWLMAGALLGEAGHSSTEPTLRTAGAYVEEISISWMQEHEY